MLTGLLELDLEGLLAGQEFNGTKWDSYVRRIQEKLAGKPKVSGADLMTMCLEALEPENPGVKYIAGHHGGAILPFYEPYTKSRLFGGYIHTPNEQIAGFFDEGFADATGLVGMSVKTSGPGATNGVTDFYDKSMDSLRSVSISGNVPESAAGSKAFQEAPIIDIVKPVAKRTYYVTDPRDIPRVFYESFYFAATGHPGPVWVDVAKSAMIERNSVPPEEINFTYAVEKPSTDSLEEILVKLEVLASKIRDSKRPILYVGGGVKLAGAWSELTNFARKLGIPVTTSIKGKGVFPENDPLSLGMLGMHGTAYANYAIEEADLIINLGARYDDRVTGNPAQWCKQAYHVHIDIDPQGIGPNRLRQPDLTIKFDVKNILRVLNQLANQRPDVKPNLEDWYNALSFLKQEFPLWYGDREKLLRPETNLARKLNNFKSHLPTMYFSFPKFAERVLRSIEDYFKYLSFVSDFKLPNSVFLRRREPTKPQYVTEMIHRETRGIYAVVADVGQHQMWTAQYYLTNDPRNWDTSGGAGTMGSSLAKALGRYFGFKETKNYTPIAVIVGDESFMMNPQVLELYRRLNPNIKAFVIDNKAEDGTPGGMVRQWYRRVHNNTSLPVKGGRDIAKIARGFGVNAINVYRTGDVIPALRKALSHEGPYVVNFRVDPMEDCLPMYPSGGTIDQMITHQNPKPTQEFYRRLKERLSQFYKAA